MTNIEKVEKLRELGFEIGLSDSKTHWLSIYDKNNRGDSIDCVDKDTLLSVIEGIIFGSKVLAKENC